MTTVRCALYLRISLDATGERLAVDRQRQDCTAIAEGRGWTIVGEYVDNSISASDATKNRPGYEALSRAYTDAQFDALVCYDLDRLTRQPRQLEDWIDAAEKRGLLLVTANGEADLTTDGGRLFARIKLAVARAEVERKSARQKRAALQRAELGKPPLGVRLTGYTSQGEIVPEEAAIVRQVFERFAAGESLRGIRLWLDSEHPPRAGKQWHPSTVRGILTNPRYAGRAVYMGEANGVDGAWDAIIDGDVFDLAQAVLQDPRRRTQQGTDRKHLGSGLYQCGVCEEPLTAWSQDRYRCPKGCVTRKGTEIDRAVREIVTGVLRSPAFVELLATDTSVEAKDLTGELTRLRNRLAVIEADYDAGDIDGRRYQVATAKVEAEISALQGRMAGMGRLGDAGRILQAPDPGLAFLGAPLMAQRYLVRRLCRVRLLPAPRGRRGFDASTVDITLTVGRERG